MEVLTDSFCIDVLHGGADTPNAPLRVKESVMRVGTRILSSGSSQRSVHGFATRMSLEKLILSALHRQDPSFNIPPLILNRSSSRSVASCHLAIVTFSSTPITSLRSCFRTGIHCDVETSLLSDLCNLYLCSRWPLVNCSKFCLGLLA